MLDLANFDSDLFIEILIFVYQTVEKQRCQESVQYNLFSQHNIFECIYFAADLTSLDFHVNVKRAERKRTNKFIHFMTM